MANKKKILVTGGAGYIGSHTLPILSEKGYEVSVLDNLERGRKDVVRDTQLFEIDLRNKEEIMQLFEKNNFDAVIHFAGLINVGESMEKPGLYLENNVTGTINLLNAMVKNGVNYFVFSSSAAVYGEPEKIPIKEDDAKNPTNTYGLTKLFVEQALPFYEHKHGLKSVSFRYFNACGASLDGENGEAHTPEGHLIPLIMRVALGEKDKFSIFGDDYPTKDGTCVRDYIHVVDLANAHLIGLEYLVDGGDSDCFNLGTGDGYTNKEIVEKAKEVTDKEFEVVMTDRRPGDPAKLIADNKKASKALDWEPEHSDLETIIETAYNWHKKHSFSLKD